MKPQYLITAQEILDEFYKKHGKCTVVSVQRTSHPLTIKVILDSGETVQLHGKLASVVLKDMYTCKTCGGIMSTIHDSLYCPTCSIPVCPTCSIPVYLHCDGCKKMHNADDIYEFWGNVMHPCGGGYVGQNFFDDNEFPDTKAEKSRRIQVGSFDNNRIRVYALRYCRDCCARIFKITEKE